LRRQLRGDVVTACWGGLGDFTCETSGHSVQTGARLGVLPLSGSRPSFSPSGAWVVSGGDALHRASGKVVHLGTFTSATFASNGDIFAGTSDGVLKRLCVHADAP
jgi:hypothetical protein